MDPRNKSRAFLSIGHEGWPFPVPIVRKSSKWFFDSAAGRQELLYRRIGRNELDAIELCRGYVEAQHEYALQKRGDSGVNQYAQRIISTPGKQDGLAWQNPDGTWGGPVGEKIARIIEQGYSSRAEPYHGYFYKVLKGQGPAAPLGEMDFVVKDLMIGGFALVAAPAEYGVTGVKTLHRKSIMEPSASLELAKHALLMFGIILAVGTFSGLTARLLHVPDVVVFLLVGMLAGPSVLGLVNIKADSIINQLILIFGSSYILFDGGASIRLKVLKEVWITIVVIAPVGVLITGAITGAAAWYFLGVPLIVALLLGAVLASTDPATLVPVFKQIKIKERVAQTVMSESTGSIISGEVESLRFPRST